MLPSDVAAELEGPDITALRAKHLVPLAGFLVPSIIIGYGFVLPRAGHGGVNELSIGFAATLVGAAVTYVIGVVTALRG